MQSYIRQNKKKLLYLCALLSLQIIALILAPPEEYLIVNIITSVTGVISVVMCAEKNIWFFLFAFLQTFTYMWIVWNANLKLEFGEYLFFYLPTTIWAVFVWLRNLEPDSKTEVKPKRLPFLGWVIAIAVTAISTFAFGTFDIQVLGGALPFLDAFTISFTVIAQILMVLCYREQWFFWIVLDIASVITFALLGQWMVFTMYVAWTINCIYGWVQWSRVHQISDLVGEVA